MKRLNAIVLLLLVSLILPACDRKAEPPSPEERQAILQDAPSIFTRVDGNATLRGIENLYLGQSRDEALDELSEMCPRAMEYRTGEEKEKAWFRGCVFRQARGPIVSVRVGFWPRLDNRVSTLEVKRADIGLEAVRERFREFVDEVTVDLPRPGLLEMRAKKYQIMADIDEGAEGPTHITLGYTKKWADAQQGK